MPPNGWNETVEFIADIDGSPILMRFLVQDAPAEMRSRPASRETDIHSWLSETLDNMVDRMRASRLQGDRPSKRPQVVVELSSREHPPARPSSLNETMLHVGPLELDLIDRTAKRDGRSIDLRPREFQLLKYMMQRSDRPVSRATLV